MWISYKMKISAVAPVFNIKATYLRESINSMLTQTHEPYEIILVNDGSTRKETLDCLDEYRSNPKIKIIDQVNKKTCGALNATIKAMSGDWWAPLSSDDFWNPSKLQIQEDFVRSNPEAKVIYADFNIINEWGAVCGVAKEPEFKTIKEQQDFLRWCYFGMWSNMLVHKSVFETVGLYNEDFIAVEDYEMNIRIAKKYLFYKINVPLTTYREHPEQTTKSALGYTGEIGAQWNAMCHALADKLYGSYWIGKHESN